MKYVLGTIIITTAVLIVRLIIDFLKPSNNWNNFYSALIYRCIEHFYGTWQVISNFYLRLTIQDNLKTFYAEEQSSNYVIVD